MGHRHRVDDPTGNFLFFSDSTLIDAMPGLNAGGDAQESRPPASTLAAMQAYLGAHPDAAKGKTVVLSSLSNNTSDAASLEAMIELAKKNGATKVVVVGMGTRQDLAAGNPAVKALAEKHGAVYAELGPNNGIHSVNVPALVKNISTAAGAEVAPVAPVDDRRVDAHPVVETALRPTRRVPTGGPTDRRPGNRHVRHPGAPGFHGGPHPHGTDHTLNEALHGRATRAGAMHMLKIEHSLGVHVTDGAFGAHTIRDLQHKLHDRQTGIINQHDVRKIEELMHHRHRRTPQPGAH